LLVKDAVDVFCQALEIEIKCAQETGGKAYRIMDGKFITTDKATYIYLFNLEVELSIVDDSPIRVEIEGKKSEGQIIYCENFEILIALDDYFGQSVVQGNMYCEPWKLLEGLQNRLREIEQGKGNVDLAKKQLIGKHLMTSYPLPNVVLI